VSRQVLPAILGALLLAASASSAMPSQAPAPAPPFDELVRQGDEARAAGRLDDARTRYGKALEQRPGWPDGWWYLGTMAYERDRPRECESAFARLLALKPVFGPGWAIRGLCAFQLRAYDASRRYLDKALASGPLPDESMGRVVVFHRALLAIHDGHFEAAIAPLTQLLQVQQPTPELADACGLVLLRRAQVPSALAAADRAHVRAAGEAYCAHLARRADEAQRLYAELVGRFPRERYLHYGYGLSLAQQGDARSLEQFQREIQLFPDDLLARVELAFGLVARGRAPEALAPARKAIELAPALFVAHLAYGRALAESGDAAQGIRELEVAAKLAPDVIETQWALAKAYAGAGRSAEAARARETARKLESARKGGEGSRPPQP